MIAPVCCVECMRNLEVICFSSAIFLLKCGRQICIEMIRCDSWESEAETMLKWARGGRVQARVGCISLAVAVYCIWQERNQRIFQHNYRTVDTVLRDIDRVLCSC